MNNEVSRSRRGILKLGVIAVVMAPVAALATKNEAMRTAMKYKDTPEGDKRCSNCLQFVPGKTAKDLGGCKIFPNDNEVAPNGYCIVWVKKP